MKNLDNTMARTFAENVCKHGVLNTCRPNLDKGYTVPYYEEFLNSRTSEETRILEDLKSDLYLLKNINVSYMDLLFLLVCAEIKSIDAII